MTPEEKWSKTLAHLYMECILSRENDRLKNPIKNKGKYKSFVETWEVCMELCNKFQGKIEGDDPDFPTETSVIMLTFFMDDEIILRETIKNKMAEVMKSADEVSIDTDLKGNLRITLGFEGVYTEREV